MKKSKLALPLTLLASSTLLTSCDGFDVSSLPDKLFPVPYDALAVFLAFIVLLVVVFFVAYKPVKALIKKRGDYVEGKIKDANEKEFKANELLENANKEVKDKKVEARNIVEAAKADANKDDKTRKSILTQEQINKYETEAIKKASKKGH